MSFWDDVRAIDWYDGDIGGLEFLIGFGGIIVAVVSFMVVVGMVFTVITDGLPYWVHDLFDRIGDLLRVVWKQRQRLTARGRKLRRAEYTKKAFKAAREARKAVMESKQRENRAAEREWDVAYSKLIPNHQQPCIERPANVQVTLSKCENPKDCPDSIESSTLCGEDVQHLCPGHRVSRCFHTSCPDRVWRSTSLEYVCPGNHGTTRPDTRAHVGEVLQDNWNQKAPHWQQPLKCPNRIKTGLQDGVMRYACPCYTIRNMDSRTAASWGFTVPGDQQELTAYQKAQRAYLRFMADNL